MYYYLIPVPFNLVAIVIYLIARNRNDLKLVAFIQPITTLLSILIALLSLLTPQAVPGFTTWIVVGMVLAMIGDINNVNIADDKTLFRGLILFLIAYITYSIGLTVYNGFHVQDIAVGTVMLVLYAIVMAYLWRGLGNWKIPVSVFALLMSFMVTRAASTFFGTRFTTTQAILLTLGTLMLYYGDLELGIGRFRKPLRIKIGPLMYAGGQMLVALSLSYF